MAHKAEILDMRGRQMSIPSRDGFGVILEAPPEYEMRFFAGWFWALSPQYEPLKLSDNGRSWKKINPNSRDGNECIHVMNGLITN